MDDATRVTASVVTSPSASRSSVPVPAAAIVDEPADFGVPIGPAHADATLDQIDGDIVPPGHVEPLERQQRRAGRSGLVDA